MPKASKQRVKTRIGRCIHCLQDGLPVTSDHVFPESWYPATTARNKEKWQAPACQECNNALSKVEREILLRLSLWMAPSEHHTAGLYEKGQRTIDPDCGRDDRDRMKRAATRRRLFAELNEERRKQGLPHPPGGTRWPVSDLRGIPITAGAMLRVLEKIVRGMQYVACGLYVESPLTVVVFGGKHDRVPALVERTLANGERFAIEPGIVVRRSSDAEHPNEALFSIVIWETWKFYAAIIAGEGDRPRFRLDNSDGQMLSVDLPKQAR